MVDYEEVNIAKFNMPEIKVDGKVRRFPYTARGVAEAKGALEKAKGLAQNLGKSIRRQVRKRVLTSDGFMLK